MVFESTRTTECYHTRVMSAERGLRKGNLHVQRRSCWWRRPRRARRCTTLARATPSAARTTVTSSDCARNAAFRVKKSTMAAINNGRRGPAIVGGILTRAKSSSGRTIATRTRAPTRSRTRSGWRGICLARRRTRLARTGSTATRI